MVATVDLEIRISQVDLEIDTRYFILCSRKITTTAGKRWLPNSKIVKNCWTNDSFTVHHNTNHSLIDEISYGIISYKED